MKRCCCCADPAQHWERDTLAERLYIRDKMAQGLLEQLCTADMAAPCPALPTNCYRYQPSSNSLRARIDQLAILEKNLPRKGSPR